MHPRNPIRFRAALTCAATLLGAAVATRAAPTDLELVAQWPDHQNTLTSSSSPGQSTEVADDFDLHADIARVIVHGNWGEFGPTPTGFSVRFYAPAGDEPGALLHQVTLPTGDPGLIFDPLNPEEVDITLPAPFAATGRHFLSVQALSASTNLWGPWTAHIAQPQMAPVLERTDGGPWVAPTNFLGEVHADMAFTLWGDDGTQLLPTDPCGVWTPEPVPTLPGAVQTRLRDVEVLAPDDIWAVGDAVVRTSVNNEFERTLTLHFDGDAWSVIPSPNPEPFTNAGGLALHAVAALAPDDVWAAGSKLSNDQAGFLDPQILVLHWDGVAWREVPAPVPVNGSGWVRDILALAADDIWFVGGWSAATPQGGAARTALAMHWDGAGFEILPTPYPANDNGYALESVSAVAPDDIWAVGRGQGPGPDVTMDPYLIHWDGATWSYDSYDAPFGGHEMYDVVALAADDVWATGSLRLHYDGESWSPVEGVINRRGLLALAPDDLRAFGSGIDAYDGEAWRSVDTLASLQVLNLEAMARVQDCELLAVGSRTLIGNPQPLLLRTAPHFVDLGAALAGGSGTPDLAGHGAPVAGETVRLNLDSAPALAGGVLVAGLSRLDAAFKGGTLVPVPTLLIPALITDATGSAELQVVWPADAPEALSLFLQAWLPDLGGVAGFAASNALELRAP